MISNPFTPDRISLLATVLAIAILGGCGPSESERNQLSQLRTEVESLASRKDEIESSAWYLWGGIRKALETGSIVEADSLIEVFSKLHPESTEIKQALVLRRMF
jgi:outer membrane murein-binding lipoprotein Lpp